MEIFKNAGAVRLRSHHGKYLIAGEDKLSVSQSENGSADCAKWTVKHVGNNNIRLESCYGKYLTASVERFILGATGRKVIQSRPRNLDASVEWKPIKEGEGLKLQTASGRFLRANSGPPPYRNSVTHNVPLRSSSQHYIVWGVEILETMPLQGPSTAANPSGPTNRPGNAQEQQERTRDRTMGIPEAVLFASAGANVVDASVDMANYEELTNQIPTANSQPGNDEERACEKGADEDAEFDGDAEYDVEGGVDDGEAAGNFIDILGSIFQG